jgi:hypothetical protein
MFNGAKAVQLLLNSAKDRWGHSNILPIFLTSSQEGPSMVRLFNLVVVVIALVGLGQNAQAAPIKYVATLDGPSEFPPVASPGTGNALVIIDLVAHTLEVHTTFSGLTGNTTVAHIHAPTAVPLTGTAEVATQTPSFVGFPPGVTGGTYDQTFDMTLASTFNPAFVTANGGTAAGAEAALAAILAAGTAYFNIHTTAFTAGEIRGFLQPVAEPATMLLLGSSLVGLVGYGRKKLLNR